MEIIIKTHDINYRVYKVIFVYRYNSIIYQGKTLPAILFALNNRNGLLSKLIKKGKKKPAHRHRLLKKKLFKKIEGFT